MKIPFIGGRNRQAEEERERALSDDLDNMLRDSVAMTLSTVTTQAVDVRGIATATVPNSIAVARPNDNRPAGPSFITRHADQVDASDDVVQALMSLNSAQTALEIAVTEADGASNLPSSPEGITIASRHSNILADAIDKTRIIDEQTKAEIAKLDQEYAETSAQRKAEREEKLRREQEEYEAETLDRTQKYELRRSILAEKEDQNLRVHDAYALAHKALEEGPIIEHHEVQEPAQKTNVAKLESKRIKTTQPSAPAQSGE